MNRIALLAVLLWAGPATAAEPPQGAAKAATAPAAGKAQPQKSAAAPAKAATTKAKAPAASKAAAKGKAVPRERFTVDAESGVAAPAEPLVLPTVHGTLAFEHPQHATLRCARCHQGAPAKIAALAKDKEKPHTFCLACHRTEKRGPQLCSDCHARPGQPPAGKAPAGQAAPGAPARPAAQPEPAAPEKAGPEKAAGPRAKPPSP